MLKGIPKMQNTFTHKVLMCMIAGFGAACMVWAFRHIVQEAFWESGAGWRESLKGGTAERPRR